MPICQYIESPPTTVQPEDDFEEPLSPAPRGTDAEDAIFDQILQVLSRLGQYAEELAANFFRGLHLWLPFISHDTFHQKLLQFPASQDTRFGLLLLSICLLARAPPPLPHAAIDQEGLYMTM
ncbi:hypothetical protein LTR36_004736 [Oleoguttula mirabilis]|uniref:Uncharacterized protein n=1 Tax=Oleoguttula mirabilis TaxID=1507867 RepID=A0AAV9JGD7_9PEZI|nr:hypothetical protein LTR36_004736 [Oleoguttula mirabilis]